MHFEHSQGSLLLTAVEAWALSYVSVWSENEFDILHNPLKIRRNEIMSSGSPGKGVFVL